jgi:hypothetical protein
MSWLISGGEIAFGIALFVGLIFVIAVLRPPTGTLQERLIVSFPGAWIIVGLPLTFAFGLAVSLIVIGTGALR